MSPAKMIMQIMFLLMTERYMMLIKTMPLKKNCLNKKILVKLDVNKSAMFRFLVCVDYYAKKNIITSVKLAICSGKKNRLSPEYSIGIDSRSATLNE